LQIYFIFARFCKFQKLFDKIKAKELLKEGSKSADINEGKFVLNIDALFAFNMLYNTILKEHFKTFCEAFVVEFYLKLKLILRIITYLTYICLGN
jgi:hypothetical protein